MLKKLDRARRKAQGILDATDTGSKEKQDQIKGYKILMNANIFYVISSISS